MSTQFGIKKLIKYASAGFTYSIEAWIIDADVSDASFNYAELFHMCRKLSILIVVIWFHVCLWINYNDYWSHANNDLSEVGNYILDIQIKTFTQFIFNMYIVHTCTALFLITKTFCFFPISNEIGNFGIDSAIFISLLEKFRLKWEFLNELFFRGGSIYNRYIETLLEFIMNIWCKNIYLVYQIQI